MPDKNKLEKAKDFPSGTNKMLEHSRVKVCWLTVGLTAGAYEAALRYTMKRQ